jgi:multimeric flavodoxin WrbA
LKEGLLKSRRVSPIHKGHLHIHLPTGYTFTVAAILVLYHSQTGNTERLARAVAQGVAETEDSSVVLRKASMTTAQDMRECNAIVICSPEYFGYMAGAVKDLFDRTYEELRDDGEMNKKPFAVVICAGNDGTMALSHIERICKGYRLKKVQHPIICKGPVTKEVEDACYELGQTIAEGIKAKVF